MFFKGKISFLTISKIINKFKSKVFYLTLRLNKVLDNKIGHTSFVPSDFVPVCFRF